MEHASTGTDKAAQFRLLRHVQLIVTVDRLEEAEEVALGDVLVAEFAHTRTERELDLTRAATLTRKVPARDPLDLSRCTAKDGMLGMCRGLHRRRGVVHDALSATDHPLDCRSGRVQAELAALHASFSRAPAPQVPARDALYLLGTPALQAQE